MLVQVLALDAMLYERVHISLYLFAAGMYCVWTNSVRMVPPFFVGYILVQFLENYNHYVESNKYNLGYQQASNSHSIAATVSMPSHQDSLKVLT